jgi:hypothetical protein
MQSLCRPSLKPATADHRIYLYDYASLQALGVWRMCVGKGHCNGLSAIIPICRAAGLERARSGTLPGRHAAIQRLALAKDVLISMLRVGLGANAMDPHHINHECGPPNRGFPNAMARKGASWDRRPIRHYDIHFHHEEPLV